MGIIQFPLIAGVDESVDPKTAPPGRLRMLVNAAWKKDGLLEKRDGTAGFVKTRSDAGTVTSAKKLATRDGELLVVDAAGVLFSYSPTDTAWVPKGQLPEVALKWGSFSTANGIRCADSATTSDGKIIEAWVSGDPGRSDADNGASGGIGGVSSAIVGGVLNVRVLDKTTGAELARSTGISGTKITMCRVVVSGTSFAIIFDDNDTIRLLKSDLITTVALLADGAGEFGYMAFDAVAVGGTIVVGSYRIIATKVRVTAFSFAGALLTGPVDVITTTNADHVSAIGLHATVGENLFVVVGNKSAQAGSKVQFAVHDPATLAQTLAPVTLDATASMVIQHVGVTRVDATHAAVCWSSLTAAAGSKYMDGATSTIFVSSAGVQGNYLATWFTRMISRPFAIGGRLYMFMTDTPVTFDTASRVGTANTIQQQYPGTNSYLAGIDDTPSIAGLPHRYVGRVDVLIAGSWQYGHAPLPFALSATETRALLPYQAEAATDGYQFFQGIRRTRVLSGADLPDGHWSTVEVGGEAYFAGATFMAYDSIAPFDYGFPRPSPFCVDDSQSGSALRGNGGGAVMVDGTYIYQTVPLFTSGVGLVHRGPPSPPIRVVLAHAGGNDNKLRLAIIDQTLGCKLQFPWASTTSLASRAPRHEIYRSEVGGSDIHRRTIEPGDLVGLNVPLQQPNTSLTDTKADATISSSPSVVTLASRPLIYTASELAEVAPPSCVGVHVHRNRLLLISGNEREVWVSKDYTENPGVAAGFNESQLLVFDSPLVGIRTLGFYLIVFAEDGLFTVEGNGPTANGEDSTYAPVLVPTDRGCVNARSLVETPLGIMYESPVGISLLSQALEVSWIGAPVQDTLAAYPDITSATLDANKNLVRITCNASDGLSGVVLVFDYIRKQWSVFRYWDADAAVESTPIADAIIWQGKWTFVTPGGKVYVEDETTNRDNGDHWVVEDWELVEVDASGPLGYQRVRKIAILGDRATDCDVRLRVAVNGAATYDQDHTFPSDVVAAIGTANLTRVVKTQKNGSIRFRYTDASPTGPGAVVGTGKGAKCSAIGFDIEPQEGINRRAARAVA